MPNYKYLEKGIKIKGEDKRIYEVWTGIKDRCYCKTDKDYNNYGKRKIKVCTEWKKDFLNFYNWSINNGYKHNLTLDRIDVNGNYEPNNCRWTNAKQQARNRRNNKFISYNGETHCISEWAEILGLSTPCFFYRLKNWKDKNKIFINKKFRNVKKER